MIELLTVFLYSISWLARRKKAFFPAGLFIFLWLMPGGAEVV
jgi:hypothetical protein